MTITVTAAAWLASAAIVTGAAGLGIYQLATSSAATTSASKPASSPSPSPSSTSAIAGAASGAAQGNGNGVKTSPTPSPTPSPTKNCNGVGNPDCATNGKQFTITQVGAVANLTMSHPSEINLLINNPNAQDIHILTLTASAGDPPAPTPRPTPTSLICTASQDLHITNYSSTATGAPQYTVPGSHTLAVSLPIALIDSVSRNQNLCKGVTFPLSFSGSAEQVH
jgi:hypothetical protein